MNAVIDDDAPVGQLLSRRRAVALLGGVAGAAWLSGGTLSAADRTCVVRPQQTEGPFFVDDERLKRADIRSDPGTGRRSAGKAVNVALLVSRLNGGNCEPLPGAQVDLWQCDALGVYSDAQEKFLRGYQITDARGAVRFLTVYPGWYPGRTVHIHFKIRAKNHEFTSQLYFDDDLTDLVHAEAPYSARGRRRTRNANDGIYRRGGDQLQLDVNRTAGTLGGSLAIAMQF